MNIFKTRRLTIFLILLVSVFYSAAEIRAANLYVNTNADNTNCDDNLTLREAITLARGGFSRPLTQNEAARINNANVIIVPPAIGCPAPGYSYDGATLGPSASDQIFFENGVTTISPSSGLPFIIAPDFIHGLKPNGTKVILSGASAGNNTNGLSFTGSGSSIDGGGAENIVISNFTGAGIYIEGMFVQIFNSTINNNGGAGIYMFGRSTSGGGAINVRPWIDSNYIYSNGGGGIYFSGLIGNFSDPSCNGYITNNYIGYRDSSLTTDDGNGGDGIRVVNCSNIRIGITANDVDGGNFIGGNGGDGIQLKGVKTYNHRIVNNRIGRTATSGGGFGNDLSGISVLNGAGQAPASTFAPIQIGELNKNNVISGNAQSGIYIAEANSQAIVSNNYIGTNTGANTDLGNGNAGVAILNSAVALVGGDEQGEGNVIAYNRQGVYMTGSATSANIRRNRMFGNDFGIDLNGDGVTPNDTNDGDIGPNNLQNYPTLTAVSGGSSSTTVSGSFNSTPNRNFIVAFFGNTSCNASGYGEGRTFLGETSVATNANGNATLNAVLATNISNAGSFVTATALDTSTAQTSEFSQCQPVTCNYSLSASSTNVGSGASNGNFQITTTSGCDWTATSNASWITVTGSGNGNGTISFNVAANTGAARSGTITAGGQTYTINQAALSCTYALPVTSVNSGNGGATASFQLETQAGCAWTAVSNVSWLTIVSGTPGNGSGLVSYSRTSNTGAPRTGTITVGGQTFTVNQAAATTARTRFDFDGDGKADVSVFRPANGAWYLQQSQNGFTGATFGQSGDKIVPADYDGDGKTDVAVFRGGTWYLQRSQLGFTGIQFGAADDVPMPADYDGDGKDDPAVFRPSTGAWYLLQSTLGFTGVTFGQTGDVPVAADYDGDGKDDVAVFRTGTWYIQRSSLGFTGINFGQAGDKPVPADYDGDGKTDVAVFRSGTWYLLRSALGFTGATFGEATDKPAPADFDGDGKADIAVFRPSNGAWYLQRTQLGFTGVAFGAAADKPIPNAFVP